MLRRTTVGALGRIAAACALCAIPVLGFAPRAAAQAALDAARLAPGELAWRAEAGGTERALLAGDPAAEGLYAYRVRFPSGFRNEPHRHPDNRFVTVISGSLRVGYGERFATSALRTLPAGSVWTEPAGQAHFVWAEQGEVVIQVVGIGPSGTTSVAPSEAASAATAAAPSPSVPTPLAGTDPAAARYRLEEHWARLPPGREWGAAIGVDIAPDGRSVWVFDRCATTDSCAGSALDPIQKFDASGRRVRAFGAGRFNYPHGLAVDGEEHVWVCDGRGGEGRGHTCTKFSADGEALLTLGRPGIAGAGRDTFNGPSDVLVAPSGEIFVADGHGGDTNARIVKFTPDGRFITAWGRKGTAPGEFDTPHGLAMDAAGRLFVADRGNNRVQIFDQQGRFLAEWRQFGRPSGVFIDANDRLYVADSQSTPDTNPGFAQGIRIGRAADGLVTALIPWDETNTIEGVAVDREGIVYAGFTNTRNFRRFVPRERAAAR